MFIKIHKYWNELRLSQQTLHITRFQISTVKLVGSEDDTTRHDAQARRRLEDLNILQKKKLHKKSHEQTVNVCELDGLQVVCFLCYLFNVEAVFLVVKLDDGHTEFVCLCHAKVHTVLVERPIEGGHFVNLKQCTKSLFVALQCVQYVVQCSRIVH